MLYGGPNGCIYNYKQYIINNNFYPRYFINKLKIIYRKII